MRIIILLLACLSAYSSENVYQNNAVYIIGKHFITSHNYKSYTILICGIEPHQSFIDALSLPDLCYVRYYGPENPENNVTVLKIKVVPRSSNSYTVETYDTGDSGITQLVNIKHKEGIPFIDVIETHAIH